MSHKPKTALLVIDVQKGLFEKGTPVYNADQLLDNIAALIDKAHATGAQVFYIQHCDGRDLARNSHGWELHSRLKPTGKDFHLLKEKSNSFEATDLDAKLKSMGIKDLVITGLVTHGCIKNGCLGGLEHGYQVTLVEDAHSSYSAKADQLIQEWNQKLAGEGVLLKPAAEIAFN